jgi:hypothetical protein
MTFPSIPIRMLTPQGDHAVPRRRRHHDSSGSGVELARADRGWSGQGAGAAFAAGPFHVAQGQGLSDGYLPLEARR